MEEKRKAFLITESFADEHHEALAIGIDPSYFAPDLVPGHFERIRSMIGGEINIVLFPADYESTGERTHEGWINLHGKAVLVFPDSVDKLVQRGYLIKPA